MAFTSADIAAVKAASPGAVATESLYRLGLIYSSGQKAPIDLVEAHMWFNLAAMRGHDGAKAYRRECADMMSKAEIAAAQKAAREWLARGDEQGPAAPPTPVVKPQPAPTPIAKSKPASVQRYNRLRRYTGAAPVFAA